jgi:multiple sugar transport system permease protein
MFMLARGLLRLRIPLGISLVLATVSAGVAAWLLPPALAEWMGREDLNVTLMNTFFALVLPGLAHGFSIFLLKGFFDSLPPELYEAAMLDGAGEITMFTRITMPLCKPVLAVIALGAFTTAYGSFMFAFLTCQDPRMWTLMVFLYQFQQESSVPLVMAALVVSAIPTLLVFVFCQKIILRGIVIPTFK